ncbi:hypothetical protein C7H11_02940 [Escherichia coli]|nr:hypothetical protein C7H11_02940 [Escherichia coli]
MRTGMATLGRLMSLLSPFDVVIWMTDGWPLYESRLKGKLHVISKRYTQRIERHNLNLSRQRWLFYAYDSLRKTVVAHVFGERTMATLGRLMSLLSPFDVVICHAASALVRPDPAGHRWCVLAHTGYTRERCSLPPPDTCREPGALPAGQNGLPDGTDQPSADGCSLRHDEEQRK